MVLSRTLLVHGEVVVMMGASLLTLLVNYIQLILVLSPSTSEWAN